MSSQLTPSFNNTVDTAVKIPIPATTRIRLWDLPTRIFHWGLVAAVSTAFVTAKIGGEWMELHGKAGLAIVGLLVFRVTWGIIGSTHARFLNFAPSPAKLRAYLKGQWTGSGHNPLGALSVFALLGILLLQAVSGLFSDDEISFNGPFSALIDSSLSHRLTGLHHQISNFLLSLLVLHIIAIVFYLWFKKNNLVKPMVTGWKEGRAEESANKASLSAFIAAALIAVASVYVASGAALPKPAEPVVATPVKESQTSW